MDFKKFEKVARLGTKETEGILSGTVWVAPKLDGTNASCWLGDTEIPEGSISPQYGSRNRHLAVGSDNAGFMASTRDNGSLTMLLYEHPSWRVYGEWLVPHTIKGYLDSAWRKFYVCDVEADGVFLSPDVWGPVVETAGLDAVPHYAVVDPKMGYIEELLVTVPRYLMKEGELGEGIVLKNFGFTNRYGDLRYAKYINEGFQNRPKKVATDNQVETDLANLCVSPDLVQKNAAKIMWDRCDSPKNSEWDRKTMIPRLIETVYHDIFTERLYKVLNDMKQPTVNFKVLKGAVSRAIKEVGKEFF